jgi:hypothetical protein
MASGLGFLATVHRFVTGIVSEKLFFAPLPPCDFAFCPFAFFKGYRGRWRKTKERLVNPNKCCICAYLWDTLVAGDGVL